MMTTMKIGREEGQLPGGNIEVRMTMKREIIQEEIISEAEVDHLPEDNLFSSLQDIMNNLPEYTKEILLAMTDNSPATNEPDPATPKSTDTDNSIFFPNCFKCSFILYNSDKKIPKSFFSLANNKSNDVHPSK